MPLDWHPLLRTPLPYGSYRVDEVTPPTGYLGEGTLSAEFTISKNGKWWT